MEWNDVCVCVCAMYLCMLHECMIVCQKEGVNAECGEYCVHLGEVRKRWLVDLYGHLVHMHQKSLNRCIHTSTQHTQACTQSHTHTLCIVAKNTPMQTPCRPFRLVTTGHTVICSTHVMSLIATPGSQQSATYTAIYHFQSLCPQALVCSTVLLHFHWALSDNNTNRATTQPLSPNPAGHLLLKKTCNMSFWMCATGTWNAVLQCNCLLQNYARYNMHSDHDSSLMVHTVQWR